MIGRDKTLEVLQSALREAPGDEAELTLAAGSRSLTRCANSVIHQNVGAEDALLVARVFRDGRAGVASTHGMSAEDGRQVLEEAAELARFAPREDPAPRLPDPASYPALPTHVASAETLTPADRADRLGRVFEAAARHRLTVAGAFSSGATELAVVNTRGVAAHAPLTHAGVNLVVLDEESSGFACGFSRDADELDLDALGESAIRKCVDGRGPQDLEAGDYEVVLEPPAVAEVMEWMSYTCFSARSIHESTSALAGRIGESLMGPEVSIYDDATDPHGIVTPFDFEGRPKRRLSIVEDGVARGFACDSVWASRMGAEPTGHALPRNAGDTDPIPMNLFIGAGKTPAADLVSKVERGLLVTRFHYVNGFLDTRRALMTGMTRDGTFWIEDGKIQHPVGNLRFTQSLVDAFQAVRGISRERQRIPSWWSATAETGGLTMPTMHLGRFRFTGTSRGA